MYRNSWNKGKLYWLTENEYGDLALPLPLWPVNEKKRKILWLHNTRVEVNAKIAMEFMIESVSF